IKPNEIENILNKTRTIFPGLGDIKDKPDDPYGDFIIYHEMMKYMLSKNTEIIFLTFDNTKGDWMSKSKAPYIHYVENMYINTNEIIYILDAERILEQILNVEIDSLIPLQKSVNTEININKIIRIHPIFQNMKVTKAENDVVYELLVNGYTDISDVISDLDKSNEIMQIFKRDFPNISSNGILRYALRIINLNYTKKVLKDGSVINVNPKYLERAKTYREINELL
ncbi:PIN-like domain-containing protein, partial [Chryseobacterium sp. HMWF035]|uniref:PIN-like domain-containing protein n=1 Tax=Chryseobacterium sp. HMWF035 TaxID=2056868 RepID=UPI000D56FEED